jgi:hypothetical protein
MLRGISQRAAVVITLIGVVLLSSGLRVLPASHSAAHSCCLHMGMPCDSSQASCCTVGPQIPPATIAPAFLGLASVDAMQEFPLAMDRPVSRDAMTIAVTPSQSPPSGAFSLRI